SGTVRGGPTEMARGPSLQPRPTIPPASRSRRPVTSLRHAARSNRTACVQVDNVTAAARKPPLHDRMILTQNGPKHIVPRGTLRLMTLLVRSAAARPPPATLPLRTIAPGPSGRENSVRVSERCIRGRCQLPCTIDAFDAREGMLAAEYSRKGDGDESQTRIR